MTATDQDEAADRFARYIDRVLTPYVPDVSRWSLAQQIVQAARDEHWRCLPPTPDVIEQARTARPSDPTPEYLAKKAAITRKDPDHA